MHDIQTAAPDRLARRKVRTRKALIDAAIELLLEGGYEKLMSDTIAERADLGRRTFYNHFESKQACVLAAAKSRYADHIAAAEQLLNGQAVDQTAGAGDPAGIIATLASAMFRLIALDPLTARLIDHPRILSDAVAESQRDHMLANIAEGVVAGRFKPCLPPESLEPIIAWGFVGLVATSIPRKSQQADSLLWARFVLQTLGICDEEASDLLDR
jgi:AcrR family transcriptional regulator